MNRLIAGSLIALLFVPPEPAMLSQNEVLKPAVLPLRPSPPLPPLAERTPPRYRLIWLDQRFDCREPLLINDRGLIAGTIVTLRKTPAATEGQEEKRVLVYQVRGKKAHLLRESAGSIKDRNPFQNAGAMNLTGDIVGSVKTLVFGQTTAEVGAPLLTPTKSNTFVSELTPPTVKTVLVKSAIAAIWSESKKTLLLPGVDQHPEVIATGINRYGEVIVSAEYDATREEAGDSNRSQTQRYPNLSYFWNGKPLALGEGRANAINDLGEVVGERDGKAVLWQQGKRLILGNGNAIAINNRSQVAINGHLEEDSSPRRHGYLWAKGKKRVLPLLAEMEGSFVTGMNDRGQVIGICQNRDYSVVCLWQGGKVYDLNRFVRIPQGGSLDHMTGINNRGWIVGVAEKPSDIAGSSNDGYMESRACLLIPDTE